MFITLWSLAARYYGVDWLLLAAAIAGIMLLGDRKKEGFVLGMISSLLGIIFSVQIGSIANGMSSFLLLCVYCRGYWRWSRAAIVAS